jgi:hypothetical protein
MSNYKLYCKGGGFGNAKYHYYKVVNFKQLIFEIGLFKALLVRFNKLSTITESYGDFILNQYYKIEKTDEDLTKTIYIK